MTPRWALIWGGLAGLLAPACEEDVTNRPHGDGDADADVDGDGDGDGDGDSDADTDADGDGDTDADGDADYPGDPTACAAEGECIVAVDLGTCCACPRAVRADYAEALPCVVPWPVEGDPPAGCAEDCGECDACGEPAGAMCELEHCTLRWPGECTYNEDCDPGEICVVFDWQGRCDPDPTVCQSRDDCPPFNWCAPSDDGVRRCLILDPGRCMDAEDCGGEGWGCEGASADEPGQCVADG